jgi:hypothetical protein
VILVRTGIQDAVGIVGDAVARRPHLVVLIITVEDGIVELAGDAEAVARTGGRRIVAMPSLEILDVLAGDGSVDLLAAEGAAEGRVYLRGSIELVGSLVDSFC